MKAVHVTFHIRLETKRFVALLTLERLQFCQIKSKLNVLTFMDSFDMRVKIVNQRERLFTQLTLERPQICENEIKNGVRGSRMRKKLTFMNAVHMFV